MDTNRETDLGRWVDERLATLTPAKNWQPNAIGGLAVLQAKQSTAARSVRRWTWAVAAVSAVCLSAMAFPASRVLAQRCLNYCSTALRQSAGEPGSVRTNLKPEIGEVAPDFTLADLSGNRVKLSDFREKVILLNFWATWCSGCNVEIPWFIEFQQNYRDRGLVVLGVSLDEEGWKVVKPYVDKKKMNYRVMIGNDQIVALYGGFKSVPTTMVIDRLGRIAAIHVGVPGKNDYQAEIERLVKFPHLARLEQEQ